MRIFTRLSQQITRRLLNNISSLRQMVALAWTANAAIFVTIIFLTVIQGLVPITMAWLQKGLFDIFEQRFKNDQLELFSTNLLMILALLALVSVFQGALEQLYRFLYSEFNRSLSTHVQISVLKKVNSLTGIKYFESSEFQDILTLGAEGGQNGPGSVLPTLTGIIQSLVLLVSFIMILLNIDPLLCLLMIFTTLPHLYFHLKTSYEQVGMAEKLSLDQRRLSYYSLLLTAVEAAKEIRLYNLTDYFLNRFLGLRQKVQQTQRSQEIREIRRELFLRTLAELVSGGFLIILVSKAFTGQETVGDISIYLSAITNVQVSLLNIIYTFSSLKQQVLFFDYYKKLMGLPQPITMSTASCPVPKLEQGIRLHNISFRYSAHHPWVLKNVNLFVPKGKCLALIGLNGSGKTTLVKLLTRLYDPSGGQIFWDGIDVVNFKPDELREKIGVVFQDYARYALTAMENVQVGNIKQAHNDHAVIEAARRAGIHERFQNLAHGYQTCLNRYLTEDESAVDLSGGEWQKIALARLYMRSADFQILDEPTAALDAQSEYEIYNSFKEVVNGTTTLLISHRFSTVRMADIIAVLENGEITEYGSHEQLLALNQTYARLYKMQNEILSRKEEIIETAETCLA